MAKTKPSPAQGPNLEEKRKALPLTKENYILMIIGFGIILLGFVLMSGGGSSSPEVFDERIFSFRRITLAPILVLGGFAFEVYAIMKKGRRE